MQLLVITVLALVIFLVLIGLDIGGTVGALAFLLIVLVGGILRAWAPLVDWVRGPAAKV